MKRKSIVILAAIVLSTSASAREYKAEFQNAVLNGAQTKIEFHFKDDLGYPVSNVQVKAFLGMNFRAKGYHIAGSTSSDGVFLLEGKTCGDEILLDASKEGYYSGHEKLSFSRMGQERDVVNGRWQPWGEKRTFVFRKICNPTSMVRSRTRNFHATKALNQWIGYDLKECDFVAPHGKGKKVDFEVLINWNGKWLPEYNGMALKVRFVDPYAGYYSVDTIRESDFTGPYRAFETASYLKEACFYEHIESDGRQDEKKFNRNQCWVVRSRCKVDEFGNLETAYYSVVNNIEFGCDMGGVALLCVLSDFNPTPNDTNLEAK